VVFFTNSKEQGAVDDKLKTKQLLRIRKLSRNSRKMKKKIQESKETV